MGRAKCILQSQYPYNISARCINREWFNLPMDDVWKVFCEELTRTHFDHNLVIHTFVLMSNHYHLVGSTPDSNISACMLQFSKRTSQRLIKMGNRINQTFAGRHFKCIMQDATYFMNAYKYNYRNPVEAGICANVEDYKYSSLQFTMGRTPPLIPMAEDTLYLGDPKGNLIWLNTAPPPEKLDAFRCGTHRQYFQSKKCKNTKRLILGPHDLL